MEARYKELEEREERRAAGEEVESEASFHPQGDKVTHTVTVPEPTDPKLWCVRTFGPEKELCISLMYKAFEALTRGEEVPIYTVFYSPHLRGYIYIEAHREADVKEFIKGIRGMSAFSGFSLVPTVQMPLVFTASQMDARNSTLLKVGDWVRMRRGLYGGDLAQVEEIQDDLYTLKLKPRIHHSTELKRALKDKNQKQRRPAPRWFNKADVEASQELVVNVEPRRMRKSWLHFYIVEGEAYRDGFLYKTFKNGWFASGDTVRPQEYELQEWRNAPSISENVRPKKDMPTSKEEEDRERMPPPSLPSRAKAADSGLTEVEEGDMVIVINGDLKGLTGVISKALYGSPTVLMKPLGVAGVHDDLSIAVSRLCKYFEVGNYVKVVSGEKNGDTGFVTRLELLGPEKSWGPDASARILSLGCTEEYSAKLVDLRLTCEKPDPQDRVGEFKVEQLVQIAGHAENRAIIIRLEVDSRAVCLCSDGEKVCVSFADLEPVMLPSRGQYKKDVFCTDRKGNKIIPGCMVKAPRTMMGRAAPIHAEVLYINRDDTIFIKACEAMVGERAFRAVPGSKCEFIWDAADIPQNKGGGRGRKALPDKEPDELEMKQMTYGVTMASQMSFLRPDWHKKLGLPKRPGDAKPVQGVIEKGSSVRITGGGYKGLRGEVRALLDEKVRISILCKPKLIEVSANNVQVDDYLTAKVTRWPDSQPKTPRGSTFPVGKRARTAEQLLADATQEQSSTASDDQCWDPTWLTERSIDDSSEKGQDPDGAAPGTPLPLLGGEAPETAQPPSRASSRRRRQPRMEVDAQSNPSTPRAFGSASPFESLESPVHSPLSGPARVAKVRSPWLVEGLGVMYGDRPGKSNCGWIVKVYADMAQVLPADKQVDEPIPLSGNETRPWPCDGRGDMAIVFDGPKRGVKGKVISMQGDEVMIRNMDKLAAASGGDIISANKKDVAQYSVNPKASIQAEAAAAAVQREAEEASQAGSETGSRRHLVSETAEPWEADVLAAAKLGDEDTPRSEPEHGMQEGTPMTEGEATPMVVISETPEQRAETPVVLGGAPPGTLTPMPGGVTPVLNAGTPMLMSGGMRLGGVTPFPAQHADITPPGRGTGTETPNFAKKQDPIKGSDTPMTPVPGVTGTETPRPGTAGAAKEVAPITPAGAGIGKKAEDSSLGGASTPFESLAGVGEATPLPFLPGAATPALPPPDFKGAQTPHGGKAEGALTPGSLGGGLTPFSGETGAQTPAGPSDPKRDESTPNEMKGEVTPNSSVGLSAAASSSAPAAAAKKGSDYRTIAGVRYDRQLLEQAEGFAADGQISLKEARKLWESAMDGNNVTEVELRTLDYIVKEIRCTKGALDFLKKHISDAKKRR
eukprot:TRINITY_DN28482_c0_g1_i1.p1 TRINITY_DN28482_c0_g1~~TRINITY_DN28482_c0_g1_i1.p1  ORF type:complete len:1525 (+),score=381.40 TRINITY_DN28482_c0_g1_i1:481-4575(+)